MYRAVDDAGGLEVHGTLGSVAQQYGINYLTLRRRYRAWVSAKRPQDSEDCPSSSSAALLGVENRGGHNKMFSESQEKQIADFVEQEFFNKRIAVDREDLKLILLQFYKKFFARLTRSNTAPPFHASDGFVSDFMRRHRFSSRHPSISHEAAEDPMREQRLAEFRAKMDHHISTLGADMVANSDETAVYRIDKVWTCIGKMGKGSVKIDAGGNDKECLTFAPIVTFSGKKLSTVIIKAGLTQRSFANLNLPPQTVTYLNSTGWSDVEAVKKIIDVVHNELQPTANHKAALGLDLYWSHIAPEIKTYSKRKHVIVEILPAGTTSVGAPLDVGVFGPIKASMRSMWRKQRILQGGGKISMADAVNQFFSGYQRLKKSAIKHAFVKAGWKK